MEIKVTPEVLDRLAEIVSEITPKIATTLPDNRTGGCIFFCDPEGYQLMQKLVGAPNQSKLVKYRQFSREKAMRLLANPDHQLSAESRAPEEHKYGGAIRLPSGHILSFSGFSELEDALFCTVIAEIMGWVNWYDITSLFPEQAQKETHLDMWQVATAA